MTNYNLYRPIKLGVDTCVLIMLLLAIGTRVTISHTIGITLVFAIWLIAWAIMHTQPQSPATWSLGWRPFSLGLLLLSFIVLFISTQYTTANYLTLWTNFGVCWMVYLFLVNEKPNLWWLTSAILLIQGGSAISQFLIQRDTGLQILGELPLNAALSTTATLTIGSGQWLRAYGLTTHPDQAGLIILSALFIGIQCWPTLSGWRRWVAAASFVLGIGGWFFTFSRTAWLAMVVAATIATLTYWHRQRNVQRTILVTNWHLAIVGVLVLVATTIALLLTGTVFSSSYTPTGQADLPTARRNANIALTLYQDNPLTGVGPHNYSATDDAELTNNVARNHILIVGAQFGVFAVTAWTFLLFAPFLRRDAFGRNGHHTTIWSIFIVYALFQSYPLPWTNFSTACLTALLFYTATVGFLPAPTQPTLIHRASS